MDERVGELLLRGGTVVDGTGAPGRRADVHCAKGRIVAVGEALAARPGAETRVIDCDGLTVAPGFIDTHSHSDLKIFETPELSMKIAQGITLEVLGQDGISVAPVRTEGVPEARRQLAGLLGNPEAASWRWSTVADYLGALRAIRPSPHLAYLVPHGTLRAFVMGPGKRAPEPGELEQMERELERALAEGAIGLSTGLIYPPCCYAQQEELIALGRVTARRGGPIVVHMRSESDHILEAIAEMVAVGRESGCAIHISHWKIAGRENFSRVDEVIGTVEAAREAGVRVTCDLYPYAAGSTMLGAILPPWVHDGGPAAAVARLGDAQGRARMRAEMTAPPPSDWDNFWRWTGPEGIVIADIPSGRSAALVGKNLAAGAQVMGVADPLELALDLLRDESLGVGMVTHSQSEAVVDRLMTRPYVNFCTDGLLGGRPHPRAYGTFPRVLGRAVRARGLLGLEEAVRKMTSQAAAAMNLSGIGQVVPGYAADLCVFDPRTVEDRATFERPTEPPRGIEHVIVAGRPAAERQGTLIERC